MLNKEKVCNPRLTWNNSIYGKVNAFKLLHKRGKNFYPVVSMTCQSPLIHVEKS